MLAYLWWTIFQVSGKGQPKIYEFDLQVLHVIDNVLGLDVPVDDTIPMQVSKDMQQLVGDRLHCGEGSLDGIDWAREQLMLRVQQSTKDQERLAWAVCLQHDVRVYVQLVTCSRL